MVIKNLIRRKGRTLLTILGVAIGVAAIISLGTLADGLEAGYRSSLSGSKADLVLTQPDKMDLALSSVDQEIGEEVREMSGVSAVDGMLQSFVPTKKIPYFYVFAYPEDGFVIARFKVIEGETINAKPVRKTEGKPLLLGKAAAEKLDKKTGDTLRLQGTTFRITGIYETGDAFEDSGAVIRLSDGQILFNKPRKVSLFYIKLKEPDFAERVIERIERRFPNFSISSAQDLGSLQSQIDIVRGLVWVIAGLAIFIGGIGMMNSQLMAIMERTREIGVLRAIGWSSRQVMLMIFGESVLVCLAGGVVGIGLGVLCITSLSGVLGSFGATVSNITPGLIGQAFLVVMTMGLIGGLYPAWRAARLQPIEALRYEGGSTGGRARRLPVGGMPIQSLWQRTTRTALTLLGITLTVGAIIALEGMVKGVSGQLNEIASKSDAEIVVRQADIADTSLSAIDQRILDKIAALPDVEYVNGMQITAIAMPDIGGFFIIMGYEPNGHAIKHFRIVEGEPLKSKHQIILGRTAAQSLKKKVGEKIMLGNASFRIVGIYETGIGWEEIGGVITLREAQAFVGRPRKSTLALIKLKEPLKAEAVVNEINTRFPDASAALAANFAEQMPDMKATDAMMNAISLLAILVSGVVVMNTMLMSVMERTREIGVLRALGWRRRRVLSLIMEESVILGLIGGVIGIGFGYLLGVLLANIPIYGEMLSLKLSYEEFIRAFVVALTLGVLGGFIPALRATRMQPIEALRYE
jgi:ABC-type antimicrobial peptide transport system permease subunit